MRLTTPIAARPVIAGAFLAVAAGCAPAPALGPAAIPELAGRTAGAPRRCVPIEQTESLRIADGGTILYGGGRTLWVNRLATQCPGIDPMDILIAEPVGSQYCRGDRVRSMDSVSRLPGPACILGDFVPYAR